MTPSTPKKSNERMDAKYNSLMSKVYLGTKDINWVMHEYIPFLRAERVAGGSQSVDRVINEIEDWVGGNIHGVKTVDWMSFTRFLRRQLESLSQPDASGLVGALEKIRELLLSGEGEVQDMKWHVKLLSKIQAVQIEALTRFKGVKG